jgi:hypothetical protein
MKTSEKEVRERKKGRRYNSSTKSSQTAREAELMAPKIHAWYMLKCSPAKYTPCSANKY